MGNELRVSVAKMSSDTEVLSKQIEKIPKVVEELQAVMKRLSDCWEGAAWVSFQNQVADDINYMNEVYQFLTNYLRALDRAKQSYAKMEKQVYGNVDRICL